MNTVWGDKMNKTNRIRTFFILGAGLLIGGSYIYQHTMQIKEEELLSIEELEPEIVQEVETKETSVAKTAYEYVIVNENGYLTVYQKDLKTVYLKTDISYSELDEELQKKIDEGYLIQNTQELYDFLENYSS